MVQRWSRDREPTSPIPLLVLDCAKILEHRGFEVVGIFRVSGSATLIKQIQKSYQKKKPVDLGTVDIHTIASLMKNYFGEMKFPLLTYDLYPQFINTMSIPQSKRVSYLKKYISVLPQPNQELLHWLLVFLNKVVTHSAVNKMDYVNIATVFGPNILRLENQSPLELLQHVTPVRIITEILLKSYRLIFTGWPDEQVEKPIKNPLNLDLGEIYACTDGEVRKKRKRFSTAAVLPSRIEGWFLSKSPRGGNSSPDSRGILTRSSTSTHEQLSPHHFEQSSPRHETIRHGDTSPHHEQSPRKARISPRKESSPTSPRRKGGDSSPRDVSPRKVLELTVPQPSENVASRVRHLLSPRAISPRKSKPETRAVQISSDQVSLRSARDIRRKRNPGRSMSGNLMMELIHSCGELDEHSDPVYKEPIIIEDTVPRAKTRKAKKKKKINIYEGSECDDSCSEQTVVDDFDDIPHIFHSEIASVLDSFAEGKANKLEPLALVTFGNKEAAPEVTNEDFNPDPPRRRKRIKSLPVVRQGSTLSPRGVTLSRDQVSPRSIVH